MTRSRLVFGHLSGGWYDRIVVVLLLCCVTAVRAHAQEEKTCSPPIDERLGSYSCQKLVDRELTRIFSEIAESIRPGLPGLLRDDQLPRQKQMFVDAQRAWEVFRAKTCEADAFENYETSGYGAALGDCWIRLTRARIDQLRRGRWGVLLGEVARVEEVDRAPGTEPSARSP